MTKEKVLALLESHRGSFLSGAKIADIIGVSRNAVWKAIKQLETEGFIIKATPNKGYCLDDSNDQLSVQGVIPFLIHTEWADNIFYYDSIDSTNKKAKELALSGASHGTVVLANHQTDGKGRYGRSFESPKDTGIYLSLILKPEQLSLSEPTLVTAEAAVEVSRTIKRVTGWQPQIKWVNDLFLHEKKICGILTEAVTHFESGAIEWIVLGIGINVVTLPEMFSPQVSKVATSIYQTSSQPVRRLELVGMLLNRLLDDESKLEEQDMLDYYREHSLLIGKQVRVTQGNRQYDAHVLGIDDKARLEVKREDGKRYFLESGEVSVTI